jgi:hypothetical protein
MPTVSITLNANQAKLIKEAFQAVHGKTPKEAIQDYIRFTVREYRMREARKQAEAQPDIWEVT